MRASKKADNKPAKTPAKNQGCPEIHISGAEGIYEEKNIAETIKDYTLRALSHQKGKPDSIVISVEKITQKPQTIKSLQVTTLQCRSSLQAQGLIQNLLKICGISDKAVKASFFVINNSNTMRGAALVLSKSATRMEPDKARGLRASRLGITIAADKILARNLAMHGINNATVKEAIILASKVAASPQVIAEFCISDNPDYTTGYISSKKFGYVRIPHMKKKGEKKGGRVFFLEEDADIDAVTGFLEKTPVIINSISPCFGDLTINEIIDHIDK